MELELNREMTVTYGEPVEIAPGVRRITAPDPGPYTFKGTNTYLVGTDSLAVIDPGPDDASHRAAILEAAGSAPITHILLTHTHKDHSEGLPALKAATGAITAGYGTGDPRREQASRHEVARRFLDDSFEPDLVLVDGDQVAGRGWTITALYTPGHAPDHLCFALEGTGILFSGDHVMGWNTSVIAPPEGRMSDYMASLDRLVVRNDRLFLPGHGERIPEPVRMVRAYIVHRRVREQQILDTVKRGASSIDQITKAVYRGIDASVFGAACLSTLAHIEHLIERGLISSNGPPTLKGTFHPLST